MPGSSGFRDTPSGDTNVRDHGSRSHVLVAEHGDRGEIGQMVKCVSHPRDTLLVAKHQHRLMALARSAQPARREHTRLRGANRRAPDIQPGMAAHAPNQDGWWRGREPGAEHRFGRPVFALLRAQDMEGRPELPVRQTGQSCPVLSLTSEGGSSISMTWPSLATLVCR